MVNASGSALGGSGNYVTGGTFSNCAGFSVHRVHDLRWVPVPVTGPVVVASCAPVQLSYRAMRELFHPLVAGWFESRFRQPTEAQRRGWPRSRAGSDTLIAAPTGSGKTLAAFLALHRRPGPPRARRHARGPDPGRLRLAAQGARQRHPEEPASGRWPSIAALAADAGIGVARASAPPCAPATRRRASGARMAQRPPHILITTPESLYILLTRESGRRALAGVRTVIVDEIHAVAADKRGAHLALSLERLDALVPARAAAAAHRPVGDADARSRRWRASWSAARGRLPDDRRRRPPPRPRPGGRGAATTSSAPCASQRACGPRSTTASPSWSREHRTTLVFVNTRRLVERVAHAPGRAPRRGRGRARTTAACRASAAPRGRAALKSGELPVVVATASLELGIDVGAVDLVCHARLAALDRARCCSASGARATALRRDAEGRAVPAHARRAGASARRCVRAVAARRARRARDAATRRSTSWRSRSSPPSRGARRCGEDELLRAGAARRARTRTLAARRLRRRARRCSPRASRRSAGGARRAAPPRPRQRRLRGAARRAPGRHHRGGAIPDTADYDVVAEPEGAAIGTVNEDFAIESMAGDVFLLGNTSWRIRRVEPGTRARRGRARRGADDPVLARRGAGAHGRAVGGGRDLRARGRGARRAGERGGRGGAWLDERVRARSPRAPSSSCDYVAAGAPALGARADARTRSSPSASSTRPAACSSSCTRRSAAASTAPGAWRCASASAVSFDFELQAAATDDGIVLSLGDAAQLPARERLRAWCARTLGRGRC